MRMKLMISFQKRMMILFVRFFCFIMCLPLRYLTTSRSTFNTVLTLTVLIIHYYFILHHVVEGMIPSFWFWFFFSSHPDALNFCFPLSPPVFSFLIACLLLSSIFYSSLLFISLFQLVQWWVHVNYRIPWWCMQSLVHYAGLKLRIKIR